MDTLQRAAEFFKRLGERPAGLLYNQDQQSEAEGALGIHPPAYWTLYGEKIDDVTARYILEGWLREWLITRWCNITTSHDSNGGARVLCYGPGASPVQDKAGSYLAALLDAAEAALEQKGDEG